jgi:hypothetical protein
MTAGVYQADGLRATGYGLQARLFGVLGLALLLASPLAGQDTTRIRVNVGTGRLTGRVTSQISGQPLPFVLISLDRPRTNLFTTEQGRFSLPELGKGEYRVLVRQLGFDPLEVLLEVTEGGPRDLELSLAPRALQLPTLVASACLPAAELEPGLRGILAAASENARRLDLMQRDYPYAGRYQKVTEVFSRDGGRLSRTSDIEEWQFWTNAYYKPGKAILPGRLPDTHDVAWFTATALLAEDFRKTHCFRFGGADSTDPVSPLVTLEFEPLASLKGPDWEGKVTLDQRGVLRRSEAHLVAKKPRDTWPAAVACEVSYDAVGGSLPVESVLICRTRAAEPWATVRLEEWRLVCQRFVKKIPGVESGFLADSSGAWQGRMCTTVRSKQ